MVFEYLVKNTFMNSFIKLLKILILYSWQICWFNLQSLLYLVFSNGYLDLILLFTFLIPNCIWCLVIYEIWITFSYHIRYSYLAFTKYFSHSGWEKAWEKAIVTSCELAALTELCIYYQLLLLHIAPSAWNTTAVDGTAQDMKCNNMRFIAFHDTAAILHCTVL